MSTLVGTQRASKTNKDKNAKSTSVPGTQTPSATHKTDRPPAKNQLSEDQLRIAQMLDSGKDVANIATVKQLSEMTGRSEEDVVVALHDAEGDLHRAVEILLEGEQGEWVEQGKKKKRSNTLKNDKDSYTNHQDGDRVDERSDRLHERPDHDRFEAPPRSGRDRRSGGPIPRLVRMRGRGANNYSGNRDREGGRSNRDFHDRSSYSGERDSQEKEADWDIDTTDTREKRGEGDRSVGRERGRGRGRGMGGGFGRRGGRGRQPRFERQNESGDGSFGTWTNETAETAEKENNNWGGESFEDAYKEDWSEDTWTGTLEESKVFTPSQTKSQIESDLTSALSDTTNTIGQRLDVGSLFSKSAEFAKAPDFTKTSEAVGDSFISQYNQQATESIKNSIGIGSSSRQNLPNLSTVTHAQPQQQPQPLSPLPLPQREIGQAVRSSLPSSMPSPILPSAASSLSQQAQQHQHQQRQRSQRSKLPPPSKIPASAVEMPGHMMPQLDVQFGVDFGADSREFSFGAGGDSAVVAASFPIATTASSGSMVNHLGQVSKASTDDSLQGSVMSSASAGSKSQQTSLPVIDVSPSRPQVYPNSVYTTPTKSDSQPLAQTASKVSGEPVAFPAATPEHKSSGIINSQRTTQSPSTLAQGTLATSKPDSSLPNFSATNGYATGNYSSHGGHKSTGLTSASSASQTFAHAAPTTQSTPSTYQNQYASQSQYAGPQAAHGVQAQYSSAGQSQFPSSQSQYPSTVSVGSSSAQNQYLASQAPFQTSQAQFAAVQSGQNQFQATGNQYATYQSSSTSFQSQTGISSSSATQSAQNSLYQTSNQQAGSSYTPTSGSFHVRDSQSSSSLQQSSSSQSGSGYQSQPATGAPGLKVTSTQSPGSYSSQTYSSSTQHTATLQTSPLSNKLGDSLSKMSLKDSALDTRQSTHYDHGSTATTTASLTSAISTSSISTVTSTVSAMATPVATSAALNSRVSSTLPVTSESKALPNPPPGVPLINPQPYIMGQVPPFYQPLYGFDEMQMLQQRLPLTGSYYDMSAFPPVPSTIAGRDQAALGSAPFTGAGSDNKQMNRVDAQSPNSSSQQQSSHGAPQQTLPFNFHYGYYYPGAVLPGAAGFQYPMFPMPPVTNAPAAHVPGTPAANQLPKTYGAHQAYASKGYDEISGTQDLAKPAYGGVQQQAKVAGGSRTGNAADMNTAAYTKSHTQGFDKQGFPGGTPPPFSLPLASATQAGPLGAAAAPYGAPFLPMMPPQPHNQAILHHQLQQDSGASSGRGLQQAATQGKTGGAKPYNAYWGN